MILYKYRIDIVNTESGSEFAASSKTLPVNTDIIKSIINSTHTKQSGNIRYKNSSCNGKFNATFSEEITILIVFTKQEPNMSV